MKTKLKKAWAYLLMLSGIMLFMLGEGFIQHKYIFERIIGGGALYIAGFYYYSVLNARLEKYGRC